MRNRVTGLLTILIVLLSYGEVDGQGRDALVELPGRIAYIGSDFNVYVMGLHNNNTTALTNDGDNPTRRYTWPTWSESGELAFFCCEGLVGAEVYMVQAESNESELVYTGEGEAFTYANWSPRQCEAGENCRDLAVLLNQVVDSQFDVRLIRNGVEDSPNTVVNTSAPFYFSWSPEGNQLLNFRNDSVLEIYDVTSEQADIIEAVPGVFQAPEWSPVDDRLLVGIRSEDGESTDLTIIAAENVIPLLTDIRGLVTFNWSPDGNYIAYSSVSERGGNLLYVIDAITGNIVAQTVADPVFAYFWSPDSASLAYVTTATPQGSFSAKQQTGGLAWGILDVANDETRRYANFIPTQQMIYMLNFFNQFAQSHSIWSPDSTHIVFGEQVSLDESTVNILNVTRSNSTPFAIADGVIGIWSYDE